MGRVRHLFSFAVLVRPVVWCWLIVGSAVAAPVTLFEDTFDLDPGSTVWTENSSGDTVGTITPSLGAAFFDVNGGTSGLSITHAISTLGYENITIEVVAYQAETSYEGSGAFGDYFTVNVGGSTAFESVGVFNGVNGNDESGLGNTVPTSTGVIVLPATAANQANLGIEIATLSTAIPEDYFISNVRVAGELIAAVPEASSAFLLGSVALGFFFWQSRRRIHRRLI